MSNLEKYLSKKLYESFGSIEIKQNYRPQWMEGLELDFYIEDLKLAAEIQGMQHYSFVQFFHGTKEKFYEQQKRDAVKSSICRERGIRLVEIFNEKDADLFYARVKDAILPKEKYSYSDSKSYILYEKLLKKFKKRTVFFPKIKDVDLEKEAKDRMSRAAVNIKKYENGEITASVEKYLAWIEIVNNKGYLRS